MYVCITYVGGTGSYSQIGADARSSEESEASMVLDLEGKTSTQIQFEILHEFGHALGLYHEHQRPDYCEVMGNYLEDDKVYAGFRRPGEESYEDYMKQFEVIADDAPDAFKYKPEYDPLSIMHYP